jgi:membrane protein YdbS with pleckstrin-like domain
MARIETPEQARLATIAESDGAADIDSPVGDEAEAAALSRRRIAIIGAAMLASGVALAALAARSSVSGPQASENEVVTMRIRPRKVMWRYLATLGLWEASRRSTAFTVTNRRVVVETGLLNRHARAIPLPRVQDVAVRTGRWQGFIDVSSRDGSRDVLIGPLRSPVARRLGSAIARGAYDAR